MTSKTIDLTDCVDLDEDEEVLSVGSNSAIEQNISTWQTKLKEIEDALLQVQIEKAELSRKQVSVGCNSLLTNVGLSRNTKAKYQEVHQRIQRAPS